MTEHDPVIVALLKRLPEAGTFWPTEMRRRWLDLMEAAFDLIYESRVEPKAAPPKPEPNAAREVTVGDEILLVATHIPEEQLRPLAKEEPFNHAPHAGQAAEVNAVAAAAPARKNVGGAPSQVGRPEGIPTNLEMASEAIRSLGPASAPQIREYVKKKYWPNLAAHWTASLYDLVASGKLKRQGINFALPDPVTAVAKSSGAKLPKALPPPRVYAPREQDEEFQHGARGVMLAPKEYLVASRLRAAMGKGHIGVQYLAENALGMKRSNGDDAKLTLRDLTAGMADRLATVGLLIEYHEGFGFLMKEVEVG